MFCFNRKNVSVDSSLDCFTVAATHKETKQFYTLYNTLDDTKLYLSKEVRSPP